MMVAASALSAAQCDAPGPIRIALEAVHHLEVVYPSPACRRRLSHPPRRTGRTALRGHHLTAPPRLQVPIGVPVCLLIPPDHLLEIVGAGLPGHLARKRTLVAQVALDLDGLPRAMPVNSAAAEVSPLRITSVLPSALRRE